MSSQLARLLNDFDPEVVIAAGAQVDDALYEAAENTVLFWAGLSAALCTFTTEQELDAYRLRREQVLRDDIIDEEELHIDATHLLRG